MVWPFKKNKIIDLTEKEIPVPKPEEEQGDVSDYKDLTPTAGSESALGFLGKIAGASSASTSRSKSVELGLNNPNIKHIQVKIEDIEYKIQNLMKKIDALIDRVDLSEKRLDRVDHR